MTDRAGSVGLIIGALGGIVTMALHPNAQSPALELVSGVAHAVAIASLTLLFAGALTVTRRLSAGFLPTLAFIAFALGGVAAMIGTSLDGFIAPGFLIDAANEVSRTRETSAALATFTFRLIQVFTRVYVISASAAIALWSASMIRRRLSRGVAVCGVAIASVVIIAVAARLVRLDMHGMLAIVVLHAIWFILVAAWLWRSDPTAEGRT